VVAGGWLEYEVVSVGCPRERGPRSGQDFDGVRRADGRYGHAAVTRVDTVAGRAHSQQRDPLRGRVRGEALKDTMRCPEDDLVERLVGHGSGLRLRPRAFAVLRLITSSNLVGCSTGRSAGFAPFGILSTYVAARR
jgi:hypothetical protein